MVLKCEHLLGSPKGLVTSQTSGSHTPGVSDSLGLGWGTRGGHLSLDVFRKLSGDATAAAAGPGTIF